MNFDLYQPDADDLMRRRQKAAAVRAKGDGSQQLASVRIVGAIDKASVGRVRSALSIAPFAESLEIFIDSTGGSVICAFDLLAMLARHPATHKTATCVRLHSAALLPCLAADRRIALPGATVLLHQMAQTPVAQSRWTRSEHLTAAADLLWLDQQFATTVSRLTGADFDVISAEMGTEQMSPVQWCIANNIIHEMEDKYVPSK